MEGFWQRYKSWILGLGAAALAYFLVFHAQFMPLRNGLYACRSMALTSTDGKHKFLAANNSLIRNPIDTNRGEWVEDYALADDDTIRIFLIDEKTMEITNRLTTVPFLAEGTPQAGGIYFRSFGVSDFVVTKTDSSAGIGQAAKVTNYYVMQCHKDW